MAADIRLFHAVVLFVMISVAPAGVHAGESARELPAQPLGMAEAVDFALSHNRVLLAAEQEVKAVGQKVRQSRSDFYPKLDAAYSYTSLKDQPYMEVESFRVPTSYTTLNRWEVEVSQPLFTGFGLTARLNMSRMDQEIAQNRLKEVRLNVIQGVKRAFLRTLLAEKLLMVERDSVSSLEVHRRNAETYHQQGLVARNDVLKAEVALSQARQRERETARRLVLLKSELNRLLDIDLQFALRLKEEEIHIRPDPPLDDLFLLAEDRRPEYLSVAASIRQAEEGVRAARSRYYPHLSAFALYYREGEDFLSERNGFTNNENAAVGVRVSLNVFEGGKTDAAIKEWQYRRKGLEEQQRDVRQRIRLEVEDAFEQLKVARVNIDTARTALKQAEENERMTTVQYKEQMVIFLEVLNAQVFVSQTRVDFFQALYGYQIARADLERAVGGPYEGGASR